MILLDGREKISTYFVGKELAVSLNFARISRLPEIMEILGSNLRLWFPQYGVGKQFHDFSLK